MTKAAAIEGEIEGPKTAKAVAKRNGTAVAEQGEPVSLLTALQAIITNPDIPIERVNQAFDIYKRMDDDQARKAFNAAIAAARSEIPPIIKKRSVDFTSAKGRTNYMHEDLAGIAKTIDPILGRHGLSYRFRTTAELNEPVRVICILSHKLGYSEENSLPAPRDESGNKNSIQALGSTITYLERYTLKAALGLSSAHDDDGNAAGKTTKPIAALITAGQADELEKLRERKGVEAQAICDFFGVQAFSEMTTPQYERAKAKLNAGGR